MNNNKFLVKYFFMELTELEKEELKNLRELQQSTRIPMMGGQYQRLNFLSLKQHHNNCTNTSCTGYHGTDDDIVCPKCGKEIFKYERINFYD